MCLYVSLVGGWACLVQRALSVGNGDVSSEVKQWHDKVEAVVKAQDEARRRMSELRAMREEEDRSEYLDTCVGGGDGGGSLLELRGEEEEGGGSRVMRVRVCRGCAEWC